MIVMPFKVFWVIVTMTHESRGWMLSNILSFQFKLFKPQVLSVASAHYYSSTSAPLQLWRQHRGSYRSACGVVGYHSKIQHDSNNFLEEKNQVESFSEPANHSI
jgi:hypothetical protein